MASRINFSLEQLLSSHDRGNAELLVLWMLAFGYPELIFEKRGRLIYPICGNSSLPPFPAHLGGRCMNYYRELCGIRFPTQNGHFTVSLDGACADLAFDILQGQDLSFAELVVLDSKIPARDCQELLDEYQAVRRSEATLFERFREALHSWWSGSNLHRLYEIE